MYCVCVCTVYHRARSTDVKRLIITGRVLFIVRFGFFGQ